MKNIKTSELYFQNGEKVTDYLRQAVNLEKYIDDKRAIIDAYYSKGQATTFDFIRNKAGYKQNGKVEDCIFKIEELEEMIVGEMNDLLSLKTDILELINKVKDLRLRRLLELKYMLGKTHERVQRYYVLFSVSYLQIA